MIQRFVDRYVEREERLRQQFEKEHPESCHAIVKAVVEVIGGKNYNPDPERVHEIDDGSYQGTLVYIIAERNMPPTKYWSVKVSYWLCINYDALAPMWLSGIKQYAPPTPEQVDEYMKLSRHIVESIHVLEGDTVIA